MINESVVLYTILKSKKKTTELLKECCRRFSLYYGSDPKEMIRTNNVDYQRPKRNYFIIWVTNYNRNFYVAYKFWDSMASKKDIDSNLTVRQFYDYIAELIKCHKESHERIKLDSINEDFS